MSTILNVIRSLTLALNEGDLAYGHTADSRRIVIRQALEEGMTLTVIGEAAGISRQRVAQLAKEGAA